MDFKGSKTEANLRAAFAGEAASRSKYDLYAEAARREGYEQLAAFFEETAQNEKAHARMWLRALEGIGTTEENLLASAVDENQLWTQVYTAMAQTAREEGFPDLAARFDGVAQAERAHELRFEKLLENLKKDGVFHKGTPALWQCRNCGHLELGPSAPPVCPVCGHPQGFFQVRAENY